MVMFYLTGLAFVVYYVINWLIHRPKVDQYDTKYVLITGCDSGFGNLLAKRLDRLGFHVFAGCLTKAGEEDLQQQSTTGNIRTVSLDAANQGSIEACYQFVQENIPKGCGLWGLVNNAGIANPVGPTEWLRREDYQRVLAVNLYGVIEMTRVFLPLILMSKSGRIVNMSSSSGTFSIPGMTPYSISKYGVEAYSDSLRRQLYKTKIKVCILEPSGFNTFITSKEGDSLRTAFDAEPEAGEDTAGKSYFDKREGDRLLSAMSSNLSLVVEAYEHSLTARMPKTRYRVGDMANAGYTVPLLPYLPTRIADLVVPCPFYTSPHVE